MKDRSGQATTEYLMLLFIAILIFVTAARAIRPYAQGLAEGLVEQINARFDKDGLYRFPMPPGR